MNEFYVVRRRKYFDWGWLEWQPPAILCENGAFHEIIYIMDNRDIVPILFTSKDSAKEARKCFGHWPKYSIMKITDPSWLN